MVTPTGTDLWRIVVSTIGFALVLFVPAMVLKEMYLAPVSPLAKVGIQLGILLSAIFLAIFVVRSDDIPWPGDEEGMTGRSVR
ncbi:hypothetical protein [Halorhabdus sp. BNX81]|uniref:hypothetical protein n=1 Tax=Halorhabdus sp. BNX81 TaxID=2980181 RepID=UPI0023DD3B47|nr:hypothetical protein [Halorhabdus sp. BNX81]WEL21084.1 hypothetical protein HBNXHr_1016 [Halorhabdus sp. BNX81]